MFTRNALIALLLAVIAGFSTMLGTVLLFFTKGKNERLVSASLAFAAGVMLASPSLTCTHNPLRFSKISPVIFGVWSFRCFFYQSV